MEKNSKGLAFFVVVFIVLCCIISCCVLAATMLFNSDFDSDVNFSVGDSEYSNYDKAEITLERGACFGFCPDYVLTITETGDVIFEGRNFVTNPGKTENYTISESKVSKIINEFEKVNFFDLEDEYVDPYVTDLPSTTLSLRLDSKFKSIKLYGLDNTVPQELIDLADFIDDVAGTEEYTKTPNNLIPDEDSNQESSSDRDSERQAVLENLNTLLQEYYLATSEYPENIDLYTNLALIGKGYDAKSLSLENYLRAGTNTSKDKTAYCYYFDQELKAYRLEVALENGDYYSIGDSELEACTLSQYLVPKDL